LGDLGNTRALHGITNVTTSFEHCKWIPIYSVPNYSPEILGSPNFGTIGPL